MCCCYVCVFSDESCSLDFLVITLYRRPSFFKDHNFCIFHEFSVLHENCFTEISLKIHCDTKALHRFIVIYWINMALLKYLKKTTGTA